MAAQLQNTGHFVQRKRREAYRDAQVAEEDFPTAMTENKNSEGNNLKLPKKK